MTSQSIRCCIVRRGGVSEGRSGTIAGAGGSDVSSLGKILEHTYLFSLDDNGFKNIPSH